MERSLNINSLKPNFRHNSNILYLMIRDCRIEDNWAVFYAQEQAIKYNQGLIIGFMFIIDIPNRQLQFLLEGLKEIEQKSKKLNIPFTIIKDINTFISNNKISQIISDFSPLKQILNFKKKINISLIDIDTHNIVPVWITSDKQEYAARTIRPKIIKNLNKFAIEIPKIKKHPVSFTDKNLQIDWSYYKSKFNNKPISWCHGGYNNGMKQLKYFITNIKGYAENRNDPKKQFISNLSPWLHFGNISSLRCYLLAKKSLHYIDTEAFIEELVIRKELSDNYCYYNKNYDSVLGLPNWALTTLKKHEHDKREYIYSLDELISGKTYDNAWNFAQTQLIDDGKIHGYMRMYWAKKIIEWTKNIETAHKYILYLNDMYSIDGNDPNGFVGVLWCFGLHDRGWKERDIYGKVRYMSRIAEKFK